MFKPLQGKVTYANVMATIAVFLALGGGAYALKGKNKIDSGDIKPETIKASDLGANAVTSAEIAANAVKSPEIAANAVKSPEIAANAAKGVDVSEATLQGVNAASVGGIELRKINFKVPFGTPSRPVLNLRGLRILASCQNFGDILDVQADSPVDNARFFVTSMTAVFPTDLDAAQDINGSFAQSLPAGTDFNVDEALPPGALEGPMVMARLHYVAPGNRVVDVQLTYDRVPPGGGCELTGMAMGS